MSSFATGGGIAESSFENPRFPARAERLANHHYKQRDPRCAVAKPKLALRPGWRQKRKWGFGFLIL